jgi:hypothetical protein
VGNRSLARWATESARYQDFSVAEGWDAALAKGADERDDDTGSVLDEIRRIAVSAAFLAARGGSTDAIVARLEVLSTQVSDPYGQSSLHYLRSDRALHAGDFGVACDEALLAARDASLAPIFLALAMRPALWGGDLARAREVARQLEADPRTGIIVTADRTAARAGIAALEGRTNDAVTGFRDALARYRDLAHDFDLACVSLDFVLLVGADHPATREAAAEARAIFERVGARPYLERLDSAMAQSAAGRLPGMTAPKTAGERQPA